MIKQYRCPDQHPEPPETDEQPDEQQQPKEYIITEEMVQCIEAWTERYPIVSKDIADVIRSRPHPAPAQPTTVNAANWTHEETMNRLQCTYDKGYADGARKAREEMLDELESKVRNNWEFLFGVLPYNDSVNKSRLLEWLDSLRHSTQEARR